MHDPTRNSFLTKTGLVRRPVYSTIPTLHTHAMSVKERQKRERYKSMCRKGRKRKKRALDQEKYNVQRKMVSITVRS